MAKSIERIKDIEIGTLFYTIIENSPDLIVIVDEKSNILFVNEEPALRLSEFHPNEVIGKSIFDFLHIDELKDAKRLFKKALKTGKATIEHRIRKKSGNWIWLKTKAIFDFKNKIVVLYIREFYKRRKELISFQRSESQLKELRDNLTEIRFWKLLQPKECKAALQEIQEMNELVINNIPNYILWKDVNLVYLGCNNKFAELVGLDEPTRIIGRTDKDFKWNKEVVDLLQKKEIEVMKNGFSEHHAIESWFENTWFKINRIPLHDSEGTVVGILTTFEDITWKKISEEALKESEEKFRNLTELLPDVIYESDMNMRITFVNPIGLEKFGFNQEDFEKGIYIPQITDDSDLGRAKENIRGILNGEITKPTEYLLKRKDESTFYAIIHSRPIIDNGKIIGMRGVLHDITERKMVEQKLKESEERFRALVETTSDWIWEVDENAVYTYVSPKVKELLGYAPEEIIGKTPFDLMPSNEAKKVGDMFQRINQSQESFGGLENLNLHKNGAEILLETSGVPIFDENKEFRGYRGIDRDITESKKKEKSLIESEERYRHLFQKAPYGIWIINPFTREIIDCNETFDHFLSIYTHKDFIGKNYQEAVALFERPTHFVPMLSQRFRQLLKQGYLDPIEFNINKADGTNLWITLQSSLFLVGGQTRVQSIIMDITKRKQVELSLKASEEKYRHLFESSPYAIVLNDLNGKLIDYNSSTQELFFKVIQGDQRGKKLLEILPLIMRNSEKIKTNITNRLQNLSNRIPIDPIEIKLELLNGEKIWVNVTSSFIEVGEETLIQTIIQNITEKKQAEIKLRESEEELRILNKELEDKVVERTQELALSEEQYRDMIDNLDVAFYKGKPKGGLIIFNRAFLDILGFDRQEKPIGIKASELIAKQSELEEYYTELMKNGVIKNFICEIKTKKEGQIFAQLNAHLIRNEKGEPIEVEGTFIDITEKFQLEKELKTRTQELSLLYNAIEQTTEGIAISNLKGWLLYLNQAFAAMHGYTPDELMGKHLSIFHTSEQMPAVEEANKQIQELGYFSGEIWHTRIDGSKFPTLMHNSLLIDENNEPYGMIATALDITERKIAEEKLQESERMLKKQNIELKKLDKVKNDFIEMAAHELKTPLISIQGYTEYILMKYENSLNDEIKADLNIVQKNIVRLRNYMNELLDVMKIDESKLKLNRNVVNITNIVLSCIGELTYLINEKNHNLILDLDKQIKLDIDEGRLFQVFSNLLSNAIKYTPKNGSIEISMGKDNNHYFFKIKDNGLGLNSDELERIFDKFEMSKISLEDDYTKVQGTGLGLYISKGIVEAHGGQIFAFSEGRGKGTTFKFTLPL